VAWAAYWSVQGTREIRTHQEDDPDWITTMTRAYRPPATGITPAAHAFTPDNFGRFELSAGAAAAQNPNPGSGKGTSTTAPGSEKRPDATNDRLSNPPPANPPSGVTPGGGTTGTVPSTPGHDTTDKKTDDRRDPKTTGRKK
jgi:hypothetical protein